MFATIQMCILLDYFCVDLTKICKCCKIHPSLVCKIYRYVRVPAGY